jgi:hypothetical protein
MAKSKITAADKAFNVRKHAIIDESMALITALQRFENDYSAHLDGNDSDAFSRVITAVRNASFMAITEESEKHGGKHSEWVPPFNR